MNDMDFLTELCCNDFHCLDPYEINNFLYTSKSTKCIVFCVTVAAVYIIVLTCIYVYNSLLISL